MAINKTFVYPFCTNRNCDNLLSSLFIYSPSVVERWVGCSVGKEMEGMQVGSLVGALDGLQVGEQVGR